MITWIKSFLFKFNIKKEKIICSAIKTQNGQVFIGQRHHDCFRDMKKAGIKNMLSCMHLQGFVTSEGRFVNREEAYEIQKNAGIKSIAKGGYRGHKLFSEDLY